MRRLQDIPALPPHAPQALVDLWEAARGPGGIDSDTEVQGLAMLDHPEFYALWDHVDELPDPLAIGGMNPHLHLITHQILENQLRQDNPPAAAEALAHLESIGVDRHRAAHLIMEGISGDIFTALKRQAPVPPEPYLHHLARLSAAQAQSRVISLAKRPGRNDPCPCGSGKKYKRCCGENGAGPSATLPRGRMILGSGFYTFDEYLEKTGDDDPLLLVENVSAVARTLEEQDVPAAAVKAYRQLVTLAEQPGQDGLLSNALQDLMFFAQNHREYIADGIAAAERLALAEDDPGQVATYRLDLADFHAERGDRETAAAIYRDVIATDPPEPYCHLRWARWLAESGEPDAAEAVYRQVIERGGMGDRAALKDAQGELAELRARP